MPACCLMHFQRCFLSASRLLRDVQSVNHIFISSCKKHNFVYSVRLARAHSIATEAYVTSLFQVELAAREYCCDQK